METMHRVSFNSKKDAEFMASIIQMDIKHNAIEIPGDGGKLVTFVIDESNINWNIISELINTHNAVDMIETIFSESEIKSAEWLRLRSTFEQGYPQPILRWPLKQLSLDLICPKCCIYTQARSMRLAKEPSLRKKSFMSLIGCNEIFCLPEVIQGIESAQAKGYEVWDTLIHRTGVRSERVKQLYIPDVALPGLILEDELERITCPVCGTTKYYPHVKGKMSIKKDALLPNTDFMLTHEWFGYGLLAWREILVSNRVARLILDQGWQGVRFKVVDVV